MHIPTFLATALVALALPSSSSAALVTKIDTAPLTLTASSQATFTFHAEDADTHHVATTAFECRTGNAAFASCTSPLTISGVAEGAHTEQIRWVAGNVSDGTPPTATWTVDTTAPDTVLTARPPATTNAETVSVTAAASEADDTYVCSYDGAPSQPCAAISHSPSLSEGTHSVAVAAVDAAGNSDPTPATATWTVDRTPPDPVTDLRVYTTTGTPTPTPTPTPPPAGPVAQHVTGPMNMPAAGPILAQPAVPITALAAPSVFVLAGPAVFQWNHPSDAVSYRVFAWEMEAGYASISPFAPTNVTAPAVAFDISEGTELCVGVQAVDAAGNASAGRQTCRDALAGWPGFTAWKARGLKKGSDPKGATGQFLTGQYPARIGFVVGQRGPVIHCTGGVPAHPCGVPHAHPSALALLVTKCPGCGRISLGLRERNFDPDTANGRTDYDNAKFSEHRTIDLRSPTTLRDQVITIPLPSAYAKGNAALAGIRVLSGKPRLQGLSLQTVDCEIPDVVTATGGTCVGSG